MEPAITLLTAILFMVSLVLTGLIVWLLYGLAKFIKKNNRIINNMKWSTFGIALALGLGAHGRGSWTWLCATILIIAVVVEGYLDTRQKLVGTPPILQPKTDGTSL